MQHFHKSFLRKWRGRVPHRTVRDATTLGKEIENVVPCFYTFGTEKEAVQNKSKFYLTKKIHTMYDAMGQKKLSKNITTVINYEKVK